MDCHQCQGIEGLFNQREAAHRLKAYRRKGPARSTRILLDALSAAGVNGATLLDIGGGIGAIQLDLLAAGVTSATDVDASTAYLVAAREEAARRGVGDRVSFRHGNFVDLAPTIAPADIVTLDRVICCYHDLRGLVGASAEKAHRLYGLVYPRDGWLTPVFVSLVNVLLRLQRNQFRIFAHRTRDVEALLRTAGLERRFHRDAGFWQVAVYARA
ncbi:MAG: methyltransferase domain-containing protein [Ktedonobacterales bacterium]